MIALNESLRANDLRHMVQSVFDVDSYESKIGDDKDISVLGFTVYEEEAAKDLENFIEMGFTFVLDAEVTPGETDDNVYKLYVELERNRKLAKNIHELLYGMKKITGIDEFRFRYFKSFKSQKATIENLDMIPKTGAEYEQFTEENKYDNIENFFNESIATPFMIDENLRFKKVFSGVEQFKVVDSGPLDEMYSKIHGPMMLNEDDIAEIMYYTKSIGDYNITKIDNKFIFENNGWAVVLEKMS